MLIDPPFEDTRGDFRAAAQAVLEALLRFETGVLALWYPVKDRRDTDRWLEELARGVGRPTIAAELWVHPPDSRAGLNGSGLVVVNPPFQFASMWASTPLLASATEVRNGLPSVPQTGKKIGLWWGNAARASSLSPSRFGSCSFARLKC